MAKFLVLCCPNSIGFGYKGLVFYKNNGCLMENIDNGLTVPKRVLINQPKIPQMPQNLSAQIVCPSPKFWDLDEKKASLGVRSPWNKSIIPTLTFVSFIIFS